jgi:uncharacterized protein YbaA (DUF1428 family)
MSYVDGYVLPVPTDRLGDYKKMATLAGKIWREHGALDYKECAGDDMNAAFGVPFSKLAKAKPNETIIFAYIVFKSKADRDKINAKVMKDPRLNTMDPKDMPFDIKRMAYGGFKVLVDPK